MSRIKLPGKEKNKKTLLIVLVIVAIGILFYEGFTKTNSKNMKNEDKVRKEMLKSVDTEESYINSETNADEKDSETDKSKINNNDEMIKITEKEKNYSARENELYNETYTLFFSNKYDNAINKANVLISEFPNDNRGYNIRGIAKAYNGDYDGGMKDIDKSLSIDGNYSYAMFNKALTYELYENIDEALKWYNKALEVEEYVWSYYGISSIYGRRGDVVNTMKYLNKAIQIDSSVKEVAKTEHDFDTVKNSEEFKRAVYN